MVERVRTILVVTFFALVVWLFAEGESLQQEEVSTRLQFVSTDASRSVELLGEWDGRVRVVLEGSRPAIDDALDLLVGQVQIAIGIGRTPAEPGRHTVNLLDVLQDQEKLRRTGARIVNVTPLQGVILIRELAPVELPIRVELPDVEVGGEARPSRDEVRVRVPMDLVQQLRDAQRWPLPVVATVPPEELEGLGPGVSVDRQATLVLPPELAADPAVQLLPGQRVNLAFTVRARLETLERRAPVQVLLPTIETGEWEVKTAPGDETVGVRIEAPKSQLDRLASGEDRLVAVAVLSSDDLTRGVPGKTLGFALLRDGRLVAPPPSMKVTPDKPEVGLAITRLEGAAP